ncbi:MAG: hypothetical protein IPH36_04095 [Saprospiraceae bacterium]|nr:hypothetical protein [Saprospiraceae bacterium]
MKIYPKQIAFIVLVLISNYLRAQTTSLVEIINIMPEKGWPECAVPENLQIIRLNEGIQVEFLDAETFKDYYYEIEFVSQTDNIVIFSSDISAQRFSISYEKLESRTDLKVKVRRVCLGNNMLKYFSNW